MPPAGPLLDVVFFDVDDTLYSTTAFAQSARRLSIQAMIDAGLKVDFEEGVAELSEVVAEFSSNYPEHFGRLLDRLDFQAFGGHNRAVLIAAGVVAYHRHKARGMVLLDDVRTMLDRMHHGGLRLGVITAGLQVKQAEKLVRLDALRFFDPAAVFFTDQIGIGKPNPKLYARACAILGVEPKRAMYVGDRLRHDIRPAGNVGMRTVHYTGAGGKYLESDVDVEPDHTLADLRDLAPILRDNYGIEV